MTGQIPFFGLMAATLVCATPALAQDQNFADRDKGYDYVFYGYSPAYGAGGPGNRAMLLMDIGDPSTPSLQSAGFAKNFNVLAANAKTSGELEAKSDTAHQIPSWELLNTQDGAPYRWRFILNDGLRIEQNAIFEPKNNHYLRSVMDVVHNGAWTRYLTDCVVPNCNVDVQDPDYWRQ